MKESSQRILLVLDLDETLIHACERPLPRAPDFTVAHYNVYCRPHLASFLAAVSQWYDLGVWSTASDEYVSRVVDQIFPDRTLLKFVWGRSKSSERRLITSDMDERLYVTGEANFRKPLKKLTRLGWPIERILIVDDSAEKAVLNYGNAIYPRAFVGDDADDELQGLALYLESLKDLSNVRIVEKRRWRETIRR